MMPTQGIRRTRGARIGLALAILLGISLARNFAHCATPITEKRFEDLNIFEMNALFLAQGSSQDGILDEEFVDEIVSAVKAIAGAFPDMQDIIERGRVRYGSIVKNGLSLVLSDEAAAVVRAKGVESAIEVPVYSRGMYKILSSTGIAELDQLNELYQAQRVEFGTYSTPYLTLRFVRTLDLLALIRIYERLKATDHIVHYRWSRTVGLPQDPFARTRKASPSFLSEYHYVSDGHEVIMIPKSETWHFVFKRGWGDCPAGCTENAYFYLTFDRKSRKVTREAELLPGQTTDGIYMWSVPTRHHLYPFPSYDSLESAARSKQWWVSVHALDVLGFILTGDENAPKKFGEDIGRVESLVMDVRNNRGAGLTTLIDSLGSPDDDVAAVAHQHLVEISGKDFGRERSSLAKWYAWLRTELH